MGTASTCGMPTLHLDLLFSQKQGVSKNPCTFSSRQVLTTGVDHSRDDVLLQDDAVLGDQALCML